MINRYLIGGIAAVVVIGGAWYHGYSYGYDKAVIENQEAREAQLKEDADNAEVIDQAKQEREVIIKEKIKYVYRTEDPSGCLKSDAPDGVYELVR